MMWNRILILILVNLWSGWCTQQPQYQVSIWMKHPNSNSNSNSNQNGTHLCNGAIIHERLILTTANCLHSKVLGSNIVNPIGAPMITVLAGSLNTPAKSLIRVNVTTINIAKGFNSTTLDNDLAILKLNESLPLDTRSDIKWIILDDHYDHKNNSCYVNFYNPTLLVQNIQQTHPVQIKDIMNCTNSTGTRKNDICSSYIINTGSICNITNDDINSSSDRGTALLCDSKLIGLLSHIIPRDDVNKNCTEGVKNLNAIYTRLATYLDWIYGKIAIESILDSKQNHTMAPPYVASSPAQSISQFNNNNQLSPTSSGISNYTTTTATFIAKTTTASPQKQSTYNNMNGSVGGGGNQKPKHNSAQFNRLTDGGCGTWFILTTITILMRLLF